MVTCVPPACSELGEEAQQVERFRRGVDGLSTRPARWYSMVPIMAVVWPAARSTESIR